MLNFNNEEPKVTSINTISAIILKELRLERKMHQALLAERVNKAPSAWSKIENGKASIDVALLFQCAAAMGLAAMDILSIIDRYAQFLSSSGFQILFNSDPETDDLREIADEYYKSPGHKLLNKQFSNFQGVSVQGGPSRNSEYKLVCLDVFRCAVEPEFRKQMNDEALEIRPNVPHVFGSAMASIFN